MMLGSEARLNILSGPDAYLYEAKLAPASALTFAAALAVYLLAFLRPDKYVPLYQCAGLKQRFGAFCIDFMLCVSLTAPPLTLIALGIEGLATGQFSLAVERDYRMGHDWIAGNLVAITMIVLLVLFSLPLSKCRRSAGAVICGYAIRSNEPIELRSACGRTLLGFITLCAMIISVPMALQRQDKRMWHDLAFDTRATMVGASAPDSAD